MRGMRYRILVMQDLYKKLNVRHSVGTLCQRNWKFVS